MVGSSGGGTGALQIVGGLPGEAGKARASRRKAGKGYYKYIMEKLDWFDILVEQSGAKKRKSNHAIEIGPNTWKSKEHQGKDIILYRIPELRIEIMSFFRWVLDTLLLKQLWQKKEIFVASTNAFKESMEKIIRKELQETYQKWTIMKGKAGSFQAVAKGKALRQKSAVLLGGCKVTAGRDVYAKLGIKDPRQQIFKPGKEKASESSGDDKVEDVDDERATDSDDSSWSKNSQDDYSGGKIKVTRRLSTQVMVFEDEQTIVAGSGYITLTKAARSRIYSDTAWICDDSIRVYMYGVLASLSLRERKPIAFASPPQGLQIIKRPRGQGLLPQCVLKTKGSLLVAVVNILSDHWICMYAYLADHDKAVVVVFDSLGSHAKQKTLSDAAYSLIAKTRNVLGDETTPWHSNESIYVEIAKQWARQQDAYNCGPLALKAAELATQINISALSKNPKTITEQKPFKKFLKSDDPGKVARRDLQDHICQWERSNPLHKLE